MSTCRVSDRHDAARAGTWSRWAACSRSWPHRAEVFPNPDYVEMFALPGTGRHSLSATQMATLLVLQVLHNYSDRGNSEAIKFDAR